MSSAQRVIKNTGLLYAKMGITMFISLYTTRLILNTLGAEDFGIFNIVGGAIATLGFLNAAMAGATQRFMSYAEGEGDLDKQKKIFNITSVIHFITAILLALALVIVGYIFFNWILKIETNRLNAAKVVYGSLIVSTIFTVMTVPYDAVLNSHENMKYYAVVGILESLLKLIVALAVVNLGGDKLIIYGILMATIPLITMTIMRFYCHKHYSECIINPRKHWDKQLMKQMTSFAGWNLMGSMAGILSQSGIGIIMNVFHGTIANASQGIANQLSGQLGVLGSSVKKALAPLITKSAGANNHALMVKTTILGTKVILFVVTFMFLPFIIEMPFILKIWLKSPPPFVQIFCSLLLLTNFINDLVLFLPQAISAVGNIKEFQIANSILLFLPVSFGFIAFSFGAPAYSIYIISATLGLFQNFVVMHFADKICGISFNQYFFNVIVKCTLAFSIVLASGYLITYFIQEGFFRLFIISLFTILSYCISFSFIGFNIVERKEIFTIIKNFYKQYNLKGKSINI